MRQGYAYTEMCQRELKQALPQANVMFPQVRQAVWSMKLVKPPVNQAQLCAVQEQLHAGQLQPLW